ncbi:MAG: GNAT family N-acetyltransferase [Salinarimonas sp.]
MSASTLEIPRLETERLVLRAWREADFEPFAAFYADAESARHVGGVDDRIGAWRRMASYAGHWQLRGYGFWALEETASGSFVGYCGLWFPEGWPEPEIGWGLMPAFRGRGYVIEAARRVRDHAYRDLGWTTLISSIDPDNHASARVAQRLGARRDGTFDLRGEVMGIWRHPGPDALDPTSGTMDRTSSTQA